MPLAASRLAAAPSRAVSARRSGRLADPASATSRTGTETGFTAVQRSSAGSGGRGVVRHSVRFVSGNVLVSSGVMQWMRAPRPPRRLADFERMRHAGLKSALAQQLAWCMYQPGLEQADTLIRSLAAAWIPVPAASGAEAFPPWDLARSGRPGFPATPRA